MSSPLLVPDDTPRTVTVVAWEAAKVAAWVFSDFVTIIGANCPQLVVDKSPGTPMAPVSVVQDEANVLIATYPDDIQPEGAAWSITTEPQNIDPMTPIDYPQFGIVS